MGVTQSHFKMTSIHKKKEIYIFIFKAPNYEFLIGTLMHRKLAVQLDFKLKVFFTLI